MMRVGVVLIILQASILAGLLAGCGLREAQICVENCPEPDADYNFIDANGDAVDSGPPPDACFPTGSEVCDGLDNDCDGTADEGPIVGLGDPCSSDVGECQAGVTECTNGEVTCSGILPINELCDTLDNDCDNMADENNPEAGLICGTADGECQTGLTQCNGGNLECIGEVGPTIEACDGLDNDCDGGFDEGIASGGSCGTTDTGQCALGTLECVGGATQCVGSVNPITEMCDNLDHDCDGNPLNGFDLQNDPRNCNTCGNVCDLDDATAACSGGNCVIAVCDPDYWDVNMIDSDGCEYGPCSFQSTQEACNNADDDCDDKVDEALMPPQDFCRTQGECTGATATCTGSGWDCNYGATVQVDMNGDIVGQETLCDGLDNDCDGAVDEGDPTKGNECFDSGQGICQGSGTYICDPMDETAPVICNITSPGQMPTTETCNNLDDDCNGTVDDGADSGALQEWVAIGGGVEIFAYEASRPDSDSMTAGSVNSYACSGSNRQPWTSVTAPDAEAACAAAGGRLCTEAEWQTACEAASTSCEWSYSTSCDTYAQDTCNGNDYDTDPGTGGNQDGVLATGSMPMCYSDWGGAGNVFDMSGNVKEWTAPRSAGVNPQRGGSTSTPGGGLRCDYNFVVASDTFFYPSVGFRCCR